jgi:hypothetical protein
MSIKSSTKVVRTLWNKGHAMHEYWWHRHETCMNWVASSIITMGQHNNFYFTVMRFKRIIFSFKVAKGQKSSIMETINGIWQLLWKNIKNWEEGGWGEEGDEVLFDRWNSVSVWCWSWQNVFTEANRLAFARLTHAHTHTHTHTHTCTHTDTHTRARAHTAICVYICMETDR